jgi:hypothetical protein
MNDVSVELSCLDLRVHGYNHWDELFPGEADTNALTTHASPRAETTVELAMCHAVPSLPRNPPIKPRWTRGDMFSLFNIQPLCVVEVKLSFITHTPSMPDACETHAQPVEKSIASLVLRLC